MKGKKNINSVHPLHSILNLLPVAANFETKLFLWKPDSKIVTAVPGRGYNPVPPCRQHKYITANCQSPRSLNIQNPYQTIFKNSLVLPRKAFFLSVTTTWKQHEHLTFEEQGEYLLSGLIHKRATVHICAHPQNPAPSGYLGMQNL